LLHTIHLGSTAAWAQCCFWGAAVAEGSWFAHLQSAGMMLGKLPVWKQILGGFSFLAGIISSVHQFGNGSSVHSVFP
jgi:hypothetical protein